MSTKAKLLPKELSLKDRVEILEDQAAQKNNTRLLLLLLLLLLGAVGVTGFVLSLVYGPPDRDAINANYNTLTNNLLQLQTYTFDALMNVSGSSGHTRVNVQNGTFVWKDEFGQTTPGAYAMDVVTIGPLNFNLLTIFPPDPGLVISPFALNRFGFTMEEFNPVITQAFPTLPSNSAFVAFPLSSANVERILVADDQGCFSNYLGLFPPAPIPVEPFCFEKPNTPSDLNAAARNGLTLLTHNPVRFADYYLAGDIVYAPDNFLDNQIFSLSAPWELVLNAI